MGTVAVGAVIAFVLGQGVGAAGPSLWVFVAWKGILGAAVGGGLAIYAARATLAKPGP